MLGLAAWIFFASQAETASAAAAPVAQVARPPADAAGPRGKAVGATTLAAAPKVTLRLDIGAARGPWTVRLTNEGDVPVRGLADERFLRFDLTPRGEHRAIRCELPALMLPEDPLDRVVVLGPHRAFVRAIDPRLYCLGPRAFGALGPGTIVVAHLGGSGRGTVGPFAVAPIEDVEPVVAPVRTLDAPPVGLPYEPTPALPPSWPHAGPSPKITLSAPETIDAPTAQDIVIPLTLRNEGSSPVVVRFRPDTLGFDVSRGGMTQPCPWPAISPHPTRELYETVAAHGSIRISLELRAYCASALLERPGLLTVWPWLDTRNASGNAIGIRSVDDLIATDRPTIVRLQHTSAVESRSVPELVDAPPSAP
jgi:hypothetical protein